MKKRYITVFYGLKEKFMHNLERTESIVERLNSGTSVNKLHHFMISFLFPTIFV